MGPTGADIARLEPEGSRTKTCSRNILRGALHVRIQELGKVQPVACLTVERIGFYNRSLCVDVANRFYSLVGEAVEDTIQCCPGLHVLGIAHLCLKEQSPPTWIARSYRPSCKAAQSCRPMRTRMLAYVHAA